MKYQARLIIYSLVFIVASLPIVLGLTFTPQRLIGAEKLFSAVDNLPAQPGKIVLVAFDFGPNSKAENLPQAKAVVEHLFRKKIPFALISIYQQAEPFLHSLPKEIAELMPEPKPRYGVDWVNLGIFPQAALQLKGMAASDDLVTTLGQDAYGRKLKEFALFSGVKTLRDIPAVIEFTSLVGAFEAYIQFLVQGDYRPTLFHGCTSISIPKAYNLLDAGLIQGLLEGAPGAAWYSTLLKEKYGESFSDQSIQVINTSLGGTVCLIIFFILMGNAIALVRGKV